jgi:hypothetical protein
LIIILTGKDKEREQSQIAQPGRANGLLEIEEENKRNAHNIGLAFLARVPALYHLLMLYFP